MAVDTEHPEAGWIPGPRGPIFVTYYAPVRVMHGRRRSHAVLLCEPLGPDRMNLHLAYRDLAMRLSEAEFAVLRFDPTGTCDASGSPRDPDWPGGWYEEAEAAQAYLVSRSGASRLAVFGARVAGTLALGLPGANALMIWGPYRDGKAFLRHEKALSRLLESNPSGFRPDFSEPDEIEGFGFVYTNAAATWLSERGVRSIRNGAFEHARVVAWDDNESHGEVTGALEAAGADVELVRIPGLAGDDLLPRQGVPSTLHHDLIGWLERLESEPVAKPSRVPSNEESLLPRAIVNRGIPHPGETEEESLRFGRTNDLFGILSRPIGLKSAPAISVVLISGGNNHRSGINRNYTEWGRELALAGVPTLRFDIRGLGDSPPNSPETLNKLYLSSTQLDVSDAIDLVIQLTNCSSVVVCGLCAGAFQAFEVARKDPRVRAVVLLDILRWVSVESASESRVLPARLTELFGRLRSVGRQHSGPPKVLLDGLGEIIGRGVRVLFVTCDAGSDGHPALDAIGKNLPALEATGRFEHEFVTDSDHIFTPIWSQAWLGRRILRFVESVSESSPGEPIWKHGRPGVPMVDSEANPGLAQSTSDYYPEPD